MIAVQAVIVASLIFGMVRRVKEEGYGPKGLAV
jgi:hypothetical protein